ncbi:maleylpyruvate isomerase N-terminal domain-containing protein [Asanoa sp. NPDC050611]|uniref:maleylpyruvate isomerase N-terminal domain-containing protein n=1 Tax=Asanoa sp. NPDC050611 TaxID=3157098 RepID=UPI0034081A35
MGAVLAGLSDSDWSRPTPCPPWDVAALVGHVVTTVSRVPGMLDAPAPESATVDAVGYYRPDDRFAPVVDAARIDGGRDRAVSAGSGAALTADFDRAWRSVVSRCAAEPTGRVVRTRHGDAMPLTEFLVTRVVEVGVHGLDLAAALGRPPWLTPRAAAVLTDLLLPDGDAALAELGWDRVTLVSKATGRAPLAPDERASLNRHGLRRLTLSPT